MPAPTSSHAPQGMRPWPAARMGLVVGLGLLLFAGTRPALGSGPPEAVKPETIPFTLEDGNITVAVSLGSGRTLPFIFDSGLTDGNVVSAETARRLGLVSKGALQYGDASGKGHAAELTEIPSVQLGEVHLRNQPFAIAKLPEQVTHRSGKPSVAGFIGAPLLEGAVVCIDYRSHVITRWAEGEFDASQRASVPLVLNHGFSTVHAIVDGMVMTLVVDTGNNGGVAVFPAYAEENDLHGRYPDLDAQQATSGSGQSFEVLSTIAKTVALSREVEVHDVPLNIIPQVTDPAWGVDGLLGYKALSRLNPCIDRDGGRVLWEIPPSGT